MKSKQLWTYGQFREELKRRFAYLMAHEEGITERQVRGHMNRISRLQLESIYLNVKSRISDEESQVRNIPLDTIVEEIDVVSDLRPTLADVVASMRAKT